MDENPPRKKIGRPKLPQGVGKEVTFRMRMPLSMREALTRVATDENMTASDFLRKLLQERLAK